MSHPLASCFVRVEVNGECGGCGFLAAPNLVCTCAHVVSQLLGLPDDHAEKPGGSLSVVFPYLPADPMSAVVDVWGPAEGAGDIALLKLEGQLPRGAYPTALLSSELCAEGPCEVIGYPSDYKVQPALSSGNFQGCLPDGTVQMERASGHPVCGGFSGAPVRRVGRWGVAGMVVDHDRANDRISFLIPADRIARLRPLDLRTHRAGEFPELTRGLQTHALAQLASLEHFLLNYLDQPGAPKPFGGRKDLMRELDTWLDDPESGYSLIVEPAGRGKSALALRWAQAVAAEERADVVFLPISQRFGTASWNVCGPLLGYRLRYLHGDTSAAPRDNEWEQEVAAALSQDAATHRPLLLVIDALDEALGWGIRDPLVLPARLGRGIKVLLTARQLADRDWEGWRRELQLAEAAGFCLPGLTLAGLRECLVAMGNPLDGLADQTALTGQLLRLSEGDPLLVGLYVEALQRAPDRVPFLTPEDLAGLEPGYRAFFDEWRKTLPKLDGAVETVLYLLAFALGPLQLRDLAELTREEDYSPERLREARASLARWVVGDGEVQGYVLSHPRLAQYFQSECRTEKQRRKWQDRFLSYGSQVLAALKTGFLNPKDVLPHVLAHYGDYLAAYGDPLQLDSLVCPQWLRAWEAGPGDSRGFAYHVERTSRMYRSAGRLADELRCALVWCSLRSRTSSIRGDLVASALACGAWGQAEALAWVSLCPDEQRRSDAIAILAGVFGADGLDEAVQVARSIGEAWPRVQALVALAPRLASELRCTAVSEALAAAREVEESDRARVLSFVIPHLPQGERDSVALEALRLAYSLEECWHRSLALGFISPYLPTELRDSVLRDALSAASSELQGALKATAVAALASMLSPDLLRRAVATTRKIRSYWSQAEALTILAGYLPPALRHGVLTEALGLAGRIRVGGHRADVIRGLAQDLPAELLGDAIRLAQSIRNRADRALALAALVPRLAPDLGSSISQRVLDAACSIGDVTTRFDVLTAASNCLSAEWHRRAVDGAFAAARCMPSGERSSAIERLLEHIPRDRQPTLVREALRGALRIGDEDRRVQALVAYLPYLSLEQQSEVLHESMKIASSPETGCRRAAALQHLAPRLPPDLLPQALEACQKVDSAYERALTLATLARCVSIEPCQPLVRRNLAAAGQIERLDERAEALASLGALLPAPGRAHVLSEALNAAEGIRRLGKRAEALLYLAPYVATSDLARALRGVLSAHLTSRDIGDLTEALARLGTALPRSLAGIALEITRNAERPYQRADALAALSPLLPAKERALVLEEALTEARSISLKWIQAEVLLDIAPRLRAGQQAQVVAEALGAAQTSGDSSIIARAMLASASSCSPKTRHSTLAETLRLSSTTEDDGDRCAVLEPLAELLLELPPKHRRCLFQTVLPILAFRPRNQYLLDLACLAPVVVSLGDARMASKVVRAVVRTGQWLP